MTGWLIFILGFGVGVAASVAGFWLLMRWMSENVGPRF